MKEWVANMKKHSALKISLIAVAVGVSFGFIVVAITGRNPWNMVVAIVRSMTGFNLSNPSAPLNFNFVLNWFLEAMPIILTGLSVGFAYRTGLFNIGGEGQFIVGAVAAASVGLLVKLPTIPHVILCILAAMAAGALWALLPGILKAYRNINEVVICIMLNYIGMYFGNWFTKAFLPIDGNTNARTIAFPVTATLGKIFPNLPSNFNWGLILVIVCVVVYWFILEKTTFGFSLRATGFNKESARFSGMKVGKNIVLSMAIAGAFAGAAGAIVIMGIFRHGRIFSMFDNYGFDGISVALVGGASAPGIALAGMLFGLLKTANSNLQLFNIPKEISELMQATIIYLVAIQYAVVALLDRLRKKKENEIIEVIEVEGGEAE